jgi:hypothetical protein
MRSRTDRASESGEAVSRSHEEQQRERSIAALKRRAADLGFVITRHLQSPDDRCQYPGFSAGLR